MILYLEYFYEIRGDILGCCIHFSYVLSLLDD